MKDDFNDLEDTNIEEENTAKNNDETSSNSFLKIDPIKNLDISNIKVETKTEEPKKSPEKQTKEDKSQNDKPVKDNSKIIKIGIAILIVILCLVGGYFAYSKFMASDESEELADNTVKEEVVEETPEETVTEENTNTVEEPITETSQELIEESQEGGPVSEEASSEENSVQVNDDNYDLVVLDKVYDEVINRGNEAYLNNFSSDELAIIRNTLYAKNGYKFKKKEYQEYFGEKSWYNPTTSSQNILTRNEEKLANIIKRYE
ncbi:MAG: YARHG domain-containing protein [Fusobacterium polymorphum]|uniref:YARHG domain-containing protein n=1 Tax=Fusobacterium nucleatum subsp. polymorphum TaxID=76857 RepID=UPI000C1B38CC|nr:YARHG domain-containing protein [Fusobacterium polymorphum]PIM76461.1 serine/threonine protein kinase [Fusobacterium polymorphum]